MANFLYIGINAQGKQVKGHLEATSERHARQLLREQGLFPRKLVASNKTASNKPVNNKTLAKPVINKASKKPRLKVAKPAKTTASGQMSYDQTALFARQLATLLAAGLPLEAALHTLGRQAETPKQASLLHQLRSRVREGHSLAASLANWPKTFSNLFIALVAAGEQAGRLDAVLARLADYLETSQKQRQKARMAMVYPVLLTLVSLSIVIALMTFVVPRIVSQFDHSGQTLPAITRGLIAISDFLTAWGWLLAAALLAVIAFTRWLLSKPKQRLNWHKYQLRLPFIGKLVRALNTARLARTLAILTASGLPLLEALKVARNTLSNDYLRQLTEHVTNEVREGVSLNKALENTGAFPPMLVYMVASGEASGELDQMLARVADLQDSEFQQKVEVTLGLFEPLMILFMGAVVLSIVLAILLPIMQLNDVLKI